MIALFIDADNFSAPAWIDEAFRRIESEEGSIAVRRAYGSAENLKGLADTLRAWTIRPFANLLLTKNTTDMALAVDAMELACQSPRPKLMIIASGDLDFVPLVVRLRERGIRVLCVSERSKMAQDAVRAYDEVFYVADAAAPPPLSNVQAQTIAVSKPTVPAAVKTEVAKPLAPKSAATKAAPAKKAPAKSAAKKVVSAIPQTITVHIILAAAPNLKAGNWQPLGDVAKLLHDQALLAKSATSTKLFKKFPQHFELMPGKQPNQVRYVLPA